MTKLDQGLGSSIKNIQDMPTQLKRKSDDSDNQTGATNSEDVSEMDQSASN
jgi:hypothetical protein